MRSHMNLLARSALPIAILGGLFATAFADKPWDGSVVQHGTMHEAIGKKQDHGRVQLSELTKQPHFYGVAALEGLAGEVTIRDGQVTMTGVDSEGQLAVLPDADGRRKATMLVGAYVPAWTRRSVPNHIGPRDFDKFVADSASAAGLNTDKPFLFSVEGKFTDVRLHVIHGACPIHARMQKIDLPKEQQPFESNLATVTGSLVGVYAKDAVGKLTHPATSTHVHLLFKDEKTGLLLTGHIEKVGLAAGAKLMLPKQSDG
ncbi:acetolactate decarboxylase [Planctomycetes bacterium K23_9]|uniref:Alpha-acetolactate decarboxylase n=1 Tax=Stieleria marina TaxID=1930275 RepID=A0A517P017_9BACT|nr:Alpha-acetolactate decarboxylase [Planctomycetes bacterium K23_9]